MEMTKKLKEGGEWWRRKEKKERVNKRTKNKHSNYSSQTDNSKKEMNNLRDKILRLWLFHDCWVKAIPFFLIFNVDFRRHCNDTSVSHFVAFLKINVLWAEDDVASGTTCTLTLAGVALRIQPCLIIYIIWGWGDKAFFTFLTFCFFLFHQRVILDTHLIDSLSFTNL